MATKNLWSCQQDVSKCFSIAFYSLRCRVSRISMARNVSKMDKSKYFKSQTSFEDNIKNNNMVFFDIFLLKIFKFLLHIAFRNLTRSDTRMIFCYLIDDVRSKLTLFFNQSNQTFNAGK